MPTLAEWSPYTTHIQGGLREGNYLNGKFVLLCAGPPFFTNVGVPAEDVEESDKVPVYPIGLTQNLSISQNNQMQRIFEVGSERSYFIGGRSMGQVSFSRILYHGPSILRCLYAWYSSSRIDDGFNMNPLVVDAAENLDTNSAPLQTTEGNGPSSHVLRIPPGYDNLFLNLGSDLFSQPFGLLLILKDSELNNVSAMYVEQCYATGHSWGVDASGLVMQEQVSIQYERLQPIRLANVIPVVSKTNEADATAQRQYSGVELG